MILSDLLIIFQVKPLNDYPYQVCSCFFPYTYLQGPQICLLLIIIYIQMLNEKKRRRNSTGYTWTQSE